MGDASAVDHSLATGDWRAPLFVGSTTPASHATVRIPGSKSLTNRYLILAALADSISVLHAPLYSRDSALMIDALQALGAEFEPIDTGSSFGPDLRVTPINFRSVAAQSAHIECGLAGTVMRFVPALAALLPGQFFFDGDAHARKRPMGALLGALRDLGVSVVTDSVAEATGLPFTLSSPGLAGASAGYVQDPAEVTIDASVSSQFVSALLLVAPRLPQGLVIRHVGDAVPSIPHIDMTVSGLRELGVCVEQVLPEHGLGEYRWRVYPGSFAGFEKTIEPDLSNAGPFLAAAMVTGTSVSIPDWPAPAADGSPGTTQVGDQWRRILPRLGGSIRFDAGALTVTGPPDINAVEGVSFDLRAAGELAPTVAAIASLTGSESSLRGIGHLRGHETDRLAALTAEITRLGGHAEETDDGLHIMRPIRRAAGDASVRVRTYDDHRMATFAAVIGLRCPSVVVENIATTGKTLPDFPRLWADLLNQLAGSR